MKKIETKSLSISNGSIGYFYSKPYSKVVSILERGYSHGNIDLTICIEYNADYQYFKDDVNYSLLIIDEYSYTSIEDNYEFLSTIISGDRFNKTVYYIYCSRLPSKQELISINRESKINEINDI